ncbi:MAG: glycosyltransferase family 39 protein [Patescibacteria group bacterium]
MKLPFRPIVWIILLGFLLRLGSMAVNYEDMRWQNDARVSIPASRILEGKGLTLKDGAGPTAYRPPLYVLWLAMDYKIFGTFATFGPSFLQILVSTANIFLLFLLTRQLWKRNDVAHAAALLLAVHPYTVYHDPALYHTFLTTALLLGCSFLLLRGAELKKTSLFFWSGLLCGLCILILSVIVPFVALCLAVALIAWKVALKTRVILLGTFVIGMMLAWGPWIVRNQLAFHHLVPLTTESGVTLWMGNNPLAKEYLAQNRQEETPVPDGTAFNIPERFAGCAVSNCRDGVSEYEESKELTAMGMVWIKAHPVDFVSLSLWRFKGIWSPFLTPHKTFFSSPILNVVLTYGFAAWNVSMFILFLLGARLAWKEKKRWELAIFVGLALSGTAAYAIFLFFTKYRVPFEALLLPFAGAGLVIVFRATRQRLHARAVK